MVDLFIILFSGKGGSVMDTHGLPFCDRWKELKKAVSSLIMGHTINLIEINLTNQVTPEKSSCHIHTS